MPKEVKMTVMVTGATGLIGACLVRTLLERDEEDIVAFHRNPAKKNLDDLIDRISLVQGDLGIFSHVLEAVGKYRPRIVYHLGAMLTAPSDADPPASFQANVAGMFHVLEAARLFEVEQVLFSSSIGSYGPDAQHKVVDDYTLQRPSTMYGVSKLFGENLGRYYKKRYGLDFRCLRYPGILGPGFRTPSVAQVFSRLVEESVMGRPYTLRMASDVKHALLYYKDAAPAMIKLAQVPEADIRMVCYLLNGIEPILTAQEIVDMVKARIPEARLTFDPDPELTQIYYSMPSFDDRCAREEWGWNPEYDYERSMDDFISELRKHPERYV
jgi:threonine 3-dehydrogenase